MKINWGRVVNAGLVAEILLLLLYQLVVLRYGHGPPVLPPRVTAPCK